MCYGHTDHCICTCVCLSFCNKESNMHSNYLDIVRSQARGRQGDREEPLWALVLAGPELQNMISSVPSRLGLVGLYVCMFVCLFLFFDTGFLCVAQLSWNSLWRLGWPQTQKSTCLWLPSAGIKGETTSTLKIFFFSKFIYHQAQIKPWPNSYTEQCWSHRNIIQPAVLVQNSNPLRKDEAEELLRVQINTTYKVRYCHRSKLQTKYINKQNIEWIKNEFRAGCWWHMPVIPPLGRQRGWWISEFEASLV